MEITLEYGPCECKPPLVGSRLVGNTVVEAPPPPAVSPEYFDREKVAAFRLREHVASGKKGWAVHCKGTHVRAAVIDGVRYGDDNS